MGARQSVVCVDQGTRDAVEDGQGVVACERDGETAVVDLDAGEAPAADNHAEGPGTQPALSLPERQVVERGELEGVGLIVLADAIFRGGDCTDLRRR